jgi:hypothetical protein
MYQKDFILRMIEMFGEMLAGILRLIKKGDYPRASEQIEKIYHNMLMEDSSFFIKIPKEELTRELLENHNFTNGHLEILAGLFNAEAELALATGDISLCLEFSEKSLLLFEFIDSEQRTYSLERINVIESIRKRIESVHQNTK